MDLFLWIVGYTVKAWGKGKGRKMFWNEKLNKTTPFLLYKN